MDDKRVNAPVDPKHLRKSAVFRRRDQEHAASVEHGVLTDVDGNRPSRAENRREILQICGADSPCTEHDVIGPVRIVRIFRRQRDTVCDRNVVGEHFKVAAVGTDAAGERDGISQRVADQPRRVAIEAVHLQISGEQRVQGCHRDGIGTQQAVDD